MLGNENFNAWLLQPEQVKQFQGITKEMFYELHDNAVQNTKGLITALFGEEAHARIANENKLDRLQKLIDQGDILEHGGLYWTQDAIADAEKAFANQEQ